MEVSDLTARVSVFAGHTVGFQPEYSCAPEDLHSLVLIDLKMPRLNGFEVLREIRASAKTSLVPVVIFTSSNEEKDIIECRRLGANNYIQKPVNFSDFTAVIQQLVFSMNLKTASGT